MLVVVDSFTEFGKNVAKPIAGKAKLIAGFIGEFCLGDELDDVGDDADEHDVTVSVDPLSSWEVETGRTFVLANRIAAVAARGFIGGITGLMVDWFKGGVKPEAATAYI